MNKLSAGVWSLVATIALASCAQKGPDANNNSPANSAPSAAPAPQLQYPAGLVPAQYPNSKVTGTMPGPEGTQDDPKLGHVFLTTQDPQDKIEDFYLQQFKDGGWECKYRKLGSIVDKNTVAHSLVANRWDPPQATAQTPIPHAYECNVSLLPDQDGTIIEVVVYRPSFH